MRKSDPNDQLGIIISIGFAAVLGPAVYHLAGAAVYFYFAIVLIWYVLVFIVLPIERSTPAKKLGLDFSNLTEQPVRISERDTAHVVDYFFGRIIILNRADLDGKNDKYRAILLHEAAHIKNGDTRFFHLFAFLAIFSLLSSFLIVYLSFEGGAFGFEDSQKTIYTVFMLSLALIFLFLADWVRRSLYRREFAADAFAFQYEPDATKYWLMSAARIEKYDKYRYSKWFTHPSFSDRHSRILKAYKASYANLFSSALRSVFLFLICGILAAFIFMMMTQWINPSLTDAVLWFYFILLLLVVASGLANLSLKTREILLNGNIKFAILHCILFGILLIFVIATNYYIIVLLGLYESITANLPPVPPEADDRTGNASLIAFFLLQPFILVLMNLAIRNSKVFARFEGIGHVILGASSYMVALYICQAFFAFLRNHILA